MAVTGIARKLATLFNTAPSPAILTLADQYNARNNIAAAPFDALAFNGMQVNGTHDVNQEFVKGSTWKIGNGYSLDGWFQYASAGALTGAQFDFSNYGFVNGLWVQVSSAITLVDPACIITSHNIEGWRTARLLWGTPYAIPLTVCFWAASYRAGAYALTIKNGAQNRGYPLLFNLPGGNVFQFFRFTIPGDTAGTWDKTNGCGLTVCFSLGCTPTWQFAPNAWATGNVNGCIGQGTYNTTSDWIQIAGFFVFPGTQAPPQDRLPYLARPYDSEVMLCKRQYERIWYHTGLIASSAAQVQTAMRWPTEKRVTPTVTVTGPIHITDEFATDYDQSAGAVTLSASGAAGGRLFLPNFSGLTASRVYNMWSTNAIVLDARM